MHASSTREPPSGVRAEANFGSRASRSSTVWASPARTASLSSVTTAIMVGARRGVMTRPAVSLAPMVDEPAPEPLPELSDPPGLGTTDFTRDLARWSETLSGIARTGMGFTQSLYERERYEEVLKVAADI